jgi:hypothetical protein
VSAAGRVAGVVGLVVLLVGLLSGCNLFVQYYEDVDELCKKIVADWKAQAEVVDASYVYVHGIDSGQQIDLDVIVRAESATAEVWERLEDIANRDYWLSTAYDREDHMSFQFVAYSSDNPPAKGGMDVADSQELGEVLRTSSVARGVGGALGG